MCLNEISGNPVILRPDFGRRISRDASDIIALSWLFHEPLVEELGHGE